MFEGGNLLNLNLTPVTNTPLKTLQPHKLCDSAAEPSLPTSVRFIYYFVFEGTVCNLHLPATICILCVHAQKSRLGRSCLKFVTQLFLHGPVLSLFGRCNLSIFKHVV